MNQKLTFEDEVCRNIKRIGKEAALTDLSVKWIEAVVPFHYAYNFRWLGRPIIQVPQDIVAIQEIIWETKPDLVIETGIAHGGSLVLSASMLTLLDVDDAVRTGASFNPRSCGRKVIGVDIEIRHHNKKAIENHPMASRIQMIEGSSVAPEVIKKVRAASEGFKRIMVCLDSNHTHDHVFAELQAYGPMVSVGNYCVVFDTGIEDLGKNHLSGWKWGKGDNPKTAVKAFLKTHPEFKMDKMIDTKLLITSASGGFLKRIG